jgi:hypothetical protein
MSSNWPPPSGQPSPDGRGELPAWPAPQGQPSTAAWPPPQAQPTTTAWPPPQPPTTAWPPPQGQPSYPPAYWQQQPAADDRVLEWVIPVNRSGLAIAAGYVGLVTLPFLILGPVAVLLGFLALADIRRNPSKRGKGRAWFGIVYGGFGTLLLLWFISQWVVSVIEG